MRAHMDSAKISMPIQAATGNNGSAFAGLNANTPWYNLTLGLAMGIGRFFFLLPLLAAAGSLAAKTESPDHVRNSTHPWSFVRGPAGGDGHPRRSSHVLPCSGTWSRGRAFPHAGWKAFLFLIDERLELDHGNPCRDTYTDRRAATEFSGARAHFCLQNSAALVRSSTRRSSSVLRGIRS